MFKKLINAFALTLVLGAFFCACPAFAGNPQEKSYCLNGVNQGTLCGGLPANVTEPCDFYNSNGYSSAEYRYRDINLYTYNCSTGPKSLNDDDLLAQCCSKFAVCYRQGSAALNGNYTESYMCNKAKQKMISNPNWIYHYTCYQNDTQNCNGNQSQ